MIINRWVALCMLIALSAGTAFGADEWDPADDAMPGTPLTISFTEQSHGPHTLDRNEPDPKDCFNVYLEAGLRYRFESTGTADIDASLYTDESRSFRVADDQDSGAGLNFELVYVPVTNGTYYLELLYFENSAGLPYAEYDLLYQAGQVLDAWDHADDTYSNATDLAVSTMLSTNGPHYLSAEDTEDWFHFFLFANNTYRFRAIGGWDTVGALYLDVPGGVPVAENDDSDIITGDEELNFDIVYTPEITGDYYLKAANYYEGDNLEYALEYTITHRADSDADGMFDDDEYIAGTDPMSPASIFAVTNRLEDGFIVEWPAYADREYRVFHAETLTNVYEQIGPVMEYPQNSYTDTVQRASGFYWVEVRLQP